MGVPVQSKSSFQLEELESRVLLSGDIAGAVAVATALTSTPSSQKPHDLPAPSETLSAIELAAPDAGQYDPAATLDSMFEAAAPSAGATDPSVAMAGPTPARVEAGAPSLESLPVAAHPQGPVALQETGVAADGIAPTAAPALPASVESTAVPADAAGEVKTLQQQLLASLHSAQGPPEGAVMLSAAVIHDSVTLASTDSSSNPDASFFPSVLPPPGTALTKITALRSGLTALRTAIGTEDS
ncbi:MAG TPA: hypothetical protein DCM86_01370, partial [Verrucomicrobiales bacterium]|nr:hypothetical protein [Verrucomicrobiales bacterium]